MKYKITEQQAGFEPTIISSTRSFHELELLAEELECVKLYLDDNNVPDYDENQNEYTVVGRIQYLVKLLNYAINNEKNI